MYLKGQHSVLPDDVALWEKAMTLWCFSCRANVGLNTTSTAQQHKYETQEHTVSQAEPCFHLNITLKAEPTFITLLKLTFLDYFIQYL